MPFEKGGRADKLGNRYEENCIIYELLKILDEMNYSVTIEALGADEKGTDILVVDSEGQIVHQQCKARNSSKEYWTLSDLDKRGVLSAWKNQLKRDCSRRVALISPIACSFLVDLHSRACNTNGVAEDFYNIQILESDKEFQKFYNNFCRTMELNDDEEKISKSIDYLKRIHYKQISEYELKEMIYQKIQFLFCTERDIVYNAFVSFIKMEDIYGQEVTSIKLSNYLNKQGIKYRLIDGDSRVIPRVNEINQEYRENFIPLIGGLRNRKEYEECIEAIKNEQSLIITGNAGYGKSGCTEVIIDFCEQNSIPHIAIKLDRRIPKRNCEEWGKDLGLPSSIAHSLHCISKHEKAVIVLDQLDALRWTQANSSEALSICMELINQVNKLNYDRKNKIIIVFVCRIYDLENDNNINSLFSKQNESDNNEWKKIRINAFEEEAVKEIVGNEYDQFSNKLKKLLRIPSSLFIWQHLDKDKRNVECSTNSHLIEKWLEQIYKKCVTAGVPDISVKEALSEIVDILNQTGRLYVPKHALNVSSAALDYLISAEIIVTQNDVIGFAHQSIFDYLVSKDMMIMYLSGFHIEAIIGEKNRQTPSRRYQVQIFLQNILEYNSGDFIAVGEQMLVSDSIRYYIKYIYFEILGQIEQPDSNITQFIMENCDNEFFGNSLLINTFLGRKQYISLLRDCEILKRWYSEPEKKADVFDLLASISPDLDKEDISFIKSNAFKERSDDEQFMRCFIHDITQESDEMFDLRMAFYEHYPEYAESEYIDMQSMMRNFEKRAIQLISFWMKNKQKHYGGKAYYYEEKIIDTNNPYLISDGEYILGELLPFIPKDGDVSIKYSDWAASSLKKGNLERTCVELVKKATIAVINGSPDSFWKYYESYLGEGYFIFNEIILYSMSHLPSCYSNQVMKYLITDMDKKIFDYTSGAKDQLALMKEILRVHGNTCSNEVFSMVEKAICGYVSPYAARLYKNRIENNKQKGHAPVYYSFWGDLQFELLKCLPRQRLSKYSKDLIEVLERRFINGSNCYNATLDFSCGWVHSPVSGKEISKRQWLQIITNKKMTSRSQSRCIEEKNGFVENSCEAFANDFILAVKNNPQEMIELVLENKEYVLPVFVDAVFSAVDVHNITEKIDFAVIEKMLIEFSCDMSSNRALYYCGIIEKTRNATWPSEVLEQIKDIALNHRNPSIEKGNGTVSGTEEENSCSSLHTRALNCVRGSAARAISHLIYENPELLPQFKDVIVGVSEDALAEVRFSALYALWSSYCVDSEWAEEKILNILEADIRMASFRYTRNMLHCLYKTYGNRVIRIIERCFESKDDQLAELGGYAVCEFFIRYGEFESVMLSLESQSNKQVKAIFEMATVYLKSDVCYRDIAKKIILNSSNLEIDMESLIIDVFSDEYLNPKLDKDFLCELMNNKFGKRAVRAFVRFLEENAVSVVEYSDIIIQVCENVLQMERKELNRQWGIADEISKLLIALYDETSNSSIDKNKKTAQRCLDLWDVMFEKQIGSVRKISQALMDR